MNQSSPKISVIVPVYNTERYLRQCLDSIVNQTLHDLEIICINDGSSDKSTVILQEYASQDSRITIINQSNQGLSASRNNALDIAQGKYVVFVDSDDWLKLNAFECLWEQADADQVDMLMFQANLYFEETQDTQFYTYTDYSAIIPEHLNDKCFTYNDFSSDWHALWKLPVMACTTLWNREFIERCHLRFPIGLYFEDNLFFRKALFQAQRIGLRKESFYYYRQHKASITRARAMHFDSLCQIILLQAEFIFRTIQDESLKRSCLSHCLIEQLYWDFWDTPLENKKRSFTIVKKTFLELLSYCKDNDFFSALNPGIREFIDLMKCSDSAHELMQSYYRTASEITDLLAEWDSFYYKPDPGNVGDALIAVATQELFSRSGLSPKEYKSLDHGVTSYNMVYGGGGAFIPDWNCLPWFIEIFSDPRIKNCLVLPQSVHNCEQLLAVFDERFTVFCRDWTSFSYCKSRNYRARFLVSDDIALSMNAKEFLDKNPSDPTFEELCFRQRLEDSLITLPNGKKILLLLRSDREGTLGADKEIYKGFNTFDLSALHSDDCENPEINRKYVKLFLSLIDQADIVLSDRLHGAIGSFLMNKEVYMLDNSYGKLSNTFELSFSKYPHVHFLKDPDDFPFWQDMNPTAFDYDRAIVPLKPLQTDSNHFMVGARFISPQGNFLVHAEISGVEHIDQIEPKSDPWIRMLVFHMMSYGGKFHIKGTVSKSLLKNIEEMVGFWCNTSPGICSPITIIPENIYNDDAVIQSSKKALVCFSGGLDACFSCYRHRKGMVGNNNLSIQAGLMIEGADIPLNEQDFLQESWQNSLMMLKDLGIDQLHSIKSNFRNFPIQHVVSGQEWGAFTHIACIAGLGSFLAPLYPNLLVGGSRNYIDSFVNIWGSNPITDPLFSSDTFNVHLDGLEYGRTEKAALVSKWELATHHLRVCWENVLSQESHIQRNCGKCEKCLRTNLNFLACGFTLPCMPAITPEMIDSVAGQIIKIKHHYKDIIDYAHAHGRGKLWWVSHLERILEESVNREKDQICVEWLNEHQDMVLQIDQFQDILKKILDSNETLQQELVLRFLNHKKLSVNNPQEWTDYLQEFLEENALFLEWKNSKRVRKLNKIVRLLSKFIIFPKARRKFRNSYLFKF
ncbi:glycosyltransferase [Akkermansia sp. N21169]|uniref:glycosyltransferase n=1 Tax=Akkermansia sp. N21169 TaxID=3040765 RepID=UPI00244ECFA7|nr:glycosyltransferase [Akkermansia sp. N21169]MDH3068345.1 glycosyltransferase [Akkermansia sp. N21169]